MRVIELKALMKECGLRGYSRLRKAELIALLQDNLQPLHTPAPYTRPIGPEDPASRDLQNQIGLLLHRKHNRLGLDQIGQDNLNL